MKPLLLIDVDGPLNPWAAKPERRPVGYTTHRMKPKGWERGNGLRVWLDHSHGKQLLALPYDLVWATTWRHEANEWIGPHLGLPELPVIDFDEPRLPTRSDGTFWKTHQVVEYVAGRPFAWIDDEFDTSKNAYDTVYVAQNHTGPALLHRINPAIGLTELDFDILRKWAESLND